MSYKFCSTCCKRISNSSVLDFCDATCQNNYVEQHCINCNILMPTVMRHKKFCSSICHNQHQRIANQITRQCKQCGNDYTVQKSSRRKKLCSSECILQYTKNADRNATRMRTLKHNNLKRYGVEYTTMTPTMIEKVKTTKLERYGQSGYSNPEKAAKTKLERYGNAKYTNTKRAVQTKIAKYGKAHFNEKSNVTKLQKYGTLDFSKKARKTTLERHGTLDFSSKQRATLLERYGGSLKDLNKNAAYLRLKEKYKNVVEFQFGQDDYKTAYHYTKYTFQCVPCKEIFDDHMTNGHAPICPVCFPKTYVRSKFENEVVAFIESLGVTGIIQNTRSVIAPKELDIYLPTQKLAIELNGVYWHSELAGKSQSYHIQKLDTCQQVDIALLQILDTEWIQKQPIIKSLLQSRVAPTLNIKTFARTCEIREVSSAEARNFFNETHLQGNTPATIKIGLFRDGIPVQMMTLSKARYTKKYEYELVRLATKLNHVVVGGTERLWAYFITTYNPISVVSYADRRFFTGKTYEKLGFTYTGNSSPNYTYFKHPLILESRQKYQKHRLGKLLAQFDPSLSEWENMKNNGFDRIWDCGHTRYEWIRK